MGNISMQRPDLPKLPVGGPEGNSVKSHTAVIKAMSDLVTDYHADATVVERLSLAFAEERRLEDTCRKYWQKGDPQKIKFVCLYKMQNIEWYHPVLFCLQMNVFACAQNTNLVFARWVEGVDDSSSCYPPGEGQAQYSEETYSTLELKFNERY